MKPLKDYKASDEKREPSLDSLKKEFMDCSADMLHNLLGVESSAIEKMLDSADSATAAKYLGMAEASSWIIRTKSWFKKSLYSVLLSHLTVLLGLFFHERNSGHLFQCRWQKWMGEMQIYFQIWLFIPKETI